MKEDEEKIKQRKRFFKKFKLVFAEKVEIFGIVGFVFSLFLLDVNANLIGAYGNAIKVNLLFGRTIASTTMFWLGFLLLCFCFLLMSARTLYHPKRKRVKLDLMFILIGIVGLMIILSGGMMLFWLKNNTIIPFFDWNLTRIAYYHVGIVFEVVTAFYFALFK
jgi:hypothetical protein